MFVNEYNNCYHLHVAKRNYEPAALLEPYSRLFHYCKRSFFFRKLCTIFIKICDVDVYRNSKRPQS